MKRKIIALLAGVLTASIALAQPMKPEDLEKYAKERYGDNSRKRTSSKALIMTHAYVNAMMDRLTDTAKNGLTGNEDQDW